MLGSISTISNRLGRNAFRNFIRNGSHGGIPGENMPFDINNRTWVTIHMFWFVATGVGSPFLIVWHQLRKK